MRKASLYTRRIKQLFSKLKKDGGKASLATAEDPMEILLLGIVSEFVPERNAIAAVHKLASEVVDYNELRVTPIAEMVQIMGVDLPKCRVAAERISQALISIFNRTHDLDLYFLKTQPKKESIEFLDSLEGLSDCSKAFFQMRCLNFHRIPLDDNMFACLQKGGYIDHSAGVAMAQRFIAGVVREKDGLKFYAMLKRYAASHGAKKKRIKAAAAGGKKKPTRKKAPQKKSAVKKKSKRVTGKSATRSKAGERRNAARKTKAAKRPAQKSSTAKKGTRTAKKKTSTRRG